MPRLPKRPEQRQRRNAHGMEIAPAPADEVARLVPKAPARILGQTRQWWNAYWGSPVSRATDISDLPALHRLFSLYDERERAMRAYKGNRLTEDVNRDGDVIGMSLNPMLSAVVRFDTEIRQLEDRFGLSPQSRLRLGIQLTEAKKTLDSLAKARKATEDDDEDADPRLAAVPEAEADPRAGGGAMD